MKIVVSVILSTLFSVYAGAAAWHAWAEPPRDVLWTCLWGALALAPWVLGLVFATRQKNRG